MHQKKIIQVLSTFDEREWRACYKYLKYCSKKGAQSLKVFEYVYKNRKNLTSNKLQASVLRKKVLPSVTDRAFLNILSELVKDVEYFLINDELLKGERAFERKQFLSLIYKRRGLYRFFERMSRDLIKELDAADSIDLFDNLKWLQVHHSLYFSEFFNKNAKPIESLIKAEEKRGLFSENLKLFYATEAYSHRILSNDTSEFNLEDTPDILTDILVWLHALTTQRDSSAYKKLESQLLNDTHSISKDLCTTILIALINHCYFLIKSGDLGILNNLAELNIFGMESGLLLYNNRLDETRFLNIVDTISKSELSISMEELISEWIKKVNSKNIKSVEQIAYALWAFGQRAYGKTLQILNNSEIRLTHRNLSFRARWMHICSLCSHYPEYESRDEVIKSSVAFFKRHRHEMNEQTYRGSLNLVAVIRMIWEKTDVSEIEQFMEECDFIMFKSWIDHSLKDVRSSP